MAFSSKLRVKNLLLFVVYLDSIVYSIKWIGYKFLSGCQVPKYPLKYQNYPSYPLKTLLDNLYGVIWIIFK